MGSSEPSQVVALAPAALSCPVPQQQLASLAALLQTEVPFLDLRSRADYLQRRLVDSYNLPLQLLPHRTFLLPDKSARFSVVAPATERIHCAGETAALASEGSDHTTGSFEDAEGFLRTRGWTNLVDVIVDSAALWIAAAEAGRLELHLPAVSVLSTRWLFAPSPALAPVMPTIEAALAQLHSGAQQAPGHAVLKCLDVGSGSCRDVAWLCARHFHAHKPTPHQVPPGQQTSQAPPQSPPAVRWEVTAIDNWLAALSRGFDMLSEAALPESCFHLMFASIDQATGALTPLQPGARASSALVSHFAESASLHIPEPDQFDLVLCVRFLARSFMARMAQCLRPGGFVVVSTFVDCERVRALGRPKDLTHVLQPGELSQRYFGHEQGFVVLKDETLAIPDGRLLCNFLAQKRALFRAGHKVA